MAVLDTVVDLTGITQSKKSPGECQGLKVLPLVSVSATVPDCHGNRHHRKMSTPLGTRRFKVRLVGIAQ